MSSEVLIKNRPPKSSHPVPEKYKKPIAPRNPAQCCYLEEIESHAMTFGIGHSEIVPLRSFMDEEMEDWIRGLFMTPRWSLECAKRRKSLINFFQRTTV